jgi:MarR family transcriptional regulator, organic hydroperoxide resistance regulator
MDTRRKQIEEIAESFYSIRRKISVEMHFYFDQEHITPSQWLVLHLAKKHKNMSIKDLASLLEITSSAVTQIVDVLVNKGLLLRKSKPGDRRTLELELSEKSKKQFESIKSKSVNTIASLFDVLDDDELSKYLELSTKIAGKILLKQSHKKEN